MFKNNGFLNKNKDRNNAIKVNYIASNIFLIAN